MTTPPVLFPLDHWIDRHQSSSGVKRGKTKAIATARKWVPPAYREGHQWFAYVRDPESSGVQWDASFGSYQKVEVDRWRAYQMLRIAVTLTGNQPDTVEAILADYNANGGPWTNYVV